MEYIQTVIAQDFGFSDEETIKSLQDCLRKLHVRFLILKKSSCSALLHFRSNFIYFIKKIFH